MEFSLLPLSFRDLEGWEDDDPSSLFPVMANCLAHISDVKPYRTGALGVTADELAIAFAAAGSDLPGTAADARKFFEQQFKPFKLIKADFDKRTKSLRKRAEEAGRKLSNMFRFCENVFGDGQEMVILVTELTISSYGSRFISRYGCKEYFDHNKELLFYERQKQIIAEMEKLEL